MLGLSAVFLLGALCGSESAPSTPAGVSSVSLKLRIDRAEYTTRLNHRDGWAVARRGHRILHIAFQLTNESGHPIEYSGHSIRFVFQMPHGLRTVAPSPMLVRDGRPVQIAPGRSLNDQVWTEVPNTVNPMVSARLMGQDMEVEFPVPATYQAQPDESMGGRTEFSALGPWDVKFDRLQWTFDRPHFSLALQPGEIFLLAGMTIANAMHRSQTLTGSSLRAEILDSEGKLYPSARVLLDQRNVPIDGQESRPKERDRVKFLFMVPRDRPYVALVLTDPLTQRRIRYDFRDTDATATDLLNIDGS
jgi:hypothetical protein